MPDLSRQLARIVAAFFAAVLVVGTAQADVNDAMREVERRGQARVIITMRTGTEANAWANARSVAQQRALVADASARMERNLSAAEIPVLKRFRTLPLAGLRVDREQLLKLAAMADVTGVYLVRPERKHQTVGATGGVEHAALANSIPSIDVPAAWSAGYDGSGLTIAVLDGGFKNSHPMLTGKAIAEACFGDTFGTTITPRCPSGLSPEVGLGAASNCPQGSTRCDHGTHVASTAVGNDGINFGVAKGAKYLPIDIFSLDNDPADCSPDPVPCEVTNSLAVLNALDYVNDNAAEFKIAAVNYSGGGGAIAGYCDDDPRKAVIDMLRAKGIAVAISAGNDGLTGQAQKPSCISSAISVGATDNGTDVPSFSNFANTVDLMAPGVGISAASGTGSGMKILSGTSMAAPHVAGAWTLLRAASPNGTADQLEEALKTTGARVTRGTAGFSVPRIQVMQAIDYLSGRNRKIFNQVVSSASAARGQAFLRVFNNSNTAGVVVATLRDVNSGAVLGKWTSPLIKPQAAPQFPISTIENEISPAGALALPFGTRLFYNMELESSFSGYVQSAVWAQATGVFQDMTSCSGGPATTDGLVVMNVHAASASFADYVSHLRITNTGSVTGTAKLTFFDAATGVQIATWTSPAIPSKASYDVTMPQIEGANAALAGATATGIPHYNVTLGALTGYIQHVIENRRVVAETDMTRKCMLTASSAIAVPNP